MSRIGRLEIELFAGTASFMKSIKEAELSVKVFGTKLRTGLGVEMKSLQGVVTGAVKGVLNLKTALAGAAAVYGAFKLASTLDAAADTVDKLGKASKRLGVTVEQLSALRFAAGESGIEFEALATMASKAGKAVAELVANGNATARIGRLNVELANSAGQVRNIAELIPDIARGIESAGSEAEQLRLAQKFFGKGGGDDFVTFLKESGTFVKGLADQTERARKLGVLFTDDQVEKLTAYRDAVGRVQEAWLGVKVKLMTEIAPAITAFLDDIALRLAGLPGLIKATLGAFRTVLAGSPEQRRLAAESIANLKNAVTNLLKVSVVELGRLVGMSIVESIRYGLRALAPEISDVFKDAIGPILSTIPGIKIDRSNRGKLAQLREQLSVAMDPATVGRLEDARRELASLNAAGPMAGMGMGMGGGMDPRARLSDEIRRLSGEAGRLKNAIAVQEAIIKQEDVDRVLAAAGATAEFKANIGALASTFTGQFVPALQAADDAISQIDIFQADGEFVGPPEPPQQKFPSIFQAFDAIAAQAQETGRQIGAGLAKGWETFKEAAKKNWEKTQDLLKEARQYRFELYPAEKVEADVAELRRVTAEVRKLGLQTALTEEEIEKLAGKWRDKLKQPEKEVRNLANDMKKAIEGFADDAANAFADFAFGAEVSLGDLLKSWGKTLLAMATKALIFKPLFDSLGDGFGKWFGTTTAGQVSTGSTSGLAEGGPVTGGSWSWVGERGPELVQFGRSGYVYPNGVMPGGGAVVQIIDQRGSGARPEVSQGRGPDGRQLIKVLIRDEVRGMISDGSLDRSMASTFGLGRRGTAR